MNCAGSGIPHLNFDFDFGFDSPIAIISRSTSCFTTLYLLNFDFGFDSPIAIISHSTSCFMTPYLLKRDKKKEESRLRCNAFPNNYESTTAGRTPATVRRCWARGLDPRRPRPPASLMSWCLTATEVGWKGGAQARSLVICDGSEEIWCE